MMLAIVVAGFFLMCLALLALFGAVLDLLCNICVLFGFDGESRETDATVVRCRYYQQTIDSDTRTASVWLEYYNSFQQKNVIYEFSYNIYEDSRNNFPILSAGEQLRIQYTPKKARCVDRRYIHPDGYKVSRYTVPIVVSVIVALIGFGIHIIALTVFIEHTN